MTIPGMDFGHDAVIPIAHRIQIYMERAHGDDICLVRPSVGAGHLSVIGWFTPQARFVQRNSILAKLHSLHRLTRRSHERGSFPGVPAVLVTQLTTLVGWSSPLSDRIIDFLY
jgi:hypothetical protein